MKNIIKAIKWIITVGVDSFLSSVVVGVLLIFVTVIGVGGVKLLLLLFNASVCDSGVAPFNVVVVLLFPSDERSCCCW